MNTSPRLNFVTDFSVGFVLFVATLVLIAALFMVGGPTDIFSNSATYEVLLPSANGLKEGSIVRFSGVAVGSVAKIDLISPEAGARAATEMNGAGKDGDARNGASGTQEEARPPGVLVTASILKQYKELIREDSFAWLQTQGLLGDAEVHIGSGSPANPVLPPGSRIAYRSRTILDEIAGENITENAADLLQAIAVMLKDLNSGVGTLGQLLKNDELYRNVNNISSAIAEASQQLTRINREVEGMLVEVRERKGTLGKLISDPRLYDEAVTTIQDVSKTSERIVRLLDEAEKSQSVLARLTTDPETGRRFAELFARLETSAAALEKILAVVVEGKGTLGIMVNDPSLAASLRDLFRGVSEYGYVQNLVRNAERVGREAYLRELELAPAEEKELLRIRAMAALKRGAAEGPESLQPAAAGDSEGKPVPAAAGPEDDKKPGPKEGAPEQDGRPPATPETGSKS